MNSIDSLNTRKQIKIDQFYFDEIWLHVVSYVHFLINRTFEHFKLIYDAITFYYRVQFTEYDGHGNGHSITNKNARRQFSFSSI